MNQLTSFLRAIASRAAEFGTRDFCPWADRYVYWLKGPLGWLALGAAAAALVGACVARQAWFFSAVAILVIVLGTVWPWLAMRGVSASIEFSQHRCHEHDPVDVTLTVRNRWPWPVWGLLLHGGFSDDHGQAHATTALSCVSGLSSSRYDFRFSPSSRGIYPTEAPSLATGFPFGLWMSRKSVTVHRSLIVWPSCVPLRSVPLLHGNRAAIVGGFTDRAGLDGDILAARPYRVGDSLKRIHWAHSARCDKLIVCDRQSTVQRSVVIVLDAAAFADEPCFHRREAINVGLRVAASLSQAFHNHCWHMTCDLNGERIPVAATLVGLHRLFDRMAEYSVPPSRPPWQAAATRNDLAFLITTNRAWNTTAGARAMVPTGCRAIVVSHSADSQTLGSGSLNQPWMQVAMDQDLGRQMKCQWERRCHDDWAA